MEPKELMSEFSKKTGIAELVPDQEGFYWVRIDDYGIGIGTEATEQSIVIFTPIAKRVEESAAVLAELMLEINYLYIGTFGGTISFNSDMGYYLYQRREALATIDAENFMSLIEQFVNKAEMLKNMVDEFVQTYAASEQIAQQKSEEMAGMEGTGEFLRV